MIGENRRDREEEARRSSRPTSPAHVGLHRRGTAPPGRKMGHAGASQWGKARLGKMDALRAAGVRVGLNPTERGSSWPRSCGACASRENSPSRQGEEAAA